MAAIGQTCNSYGYKFKVTSDHLTAEELHPLLQRYDTIGSDALDALDAIAPPPPPRAGWYTKTKGQGSQPEGDTTNPQTDRDTYALLRDNRHGDERLQTLWDEINGVPDWVDWEQIERGQQVFYRYAPAVIAGFAFQGLLATTGSAFRPAETLVRTGGHSVKVAKNRLFETFQLMLQISRSLDDVKPGGEGFASIVRVRLLHASVRNRILKLNAQRPGYFDVDKFGVPINELDSMQSVCAFSTNLVWLAMPRQGIYMRQQEALDYLALWRWVTFVIGAPSYVLDSPQRALATMESIMYDCLKPTTNSRVLAQNLVKALDRVAPIYVPKEFFEAGTRYVNGDELCDDIGIGKPGLYWMSVFFRNLFWNYIVEGKDGLKGGYKYEFKYVPKLGEQTGVESSSNPPPKEERAMLETLGLGSFILFMLMATVGSSLLLKMVLSALPINPLMAISIVKH
ncbi:hypothetical protein G7054_g7309 [Neopestalotiopsis clavispora]|nr:hypothetical protein G7054_g7309 [Neopestalotiopsis clavispora]